jgi:uncharacterized protein YyaL (SSP411 family)
MALGGIYDQLRRRVLCRYSVDAEWQIPHFEKMLYDNGPLLALYSPDLARRPRNPCSARLPRKPATGLMREMQAPDGGYYATLDADSEGEEGRFYRVDARDQVRESAEQHRGIHSPSPPVTDWN